MPSCPLLLCLTCHVFDVKTSKETAVLVGVKTFCSYFSHSTQWVRRTLDFEGSSADSVKKPNDIVYLLLELSLSPLCSVPTWPSVLPLCLWSLGLLVKNLHLRGDHSY